MRTYFDVEINMMFFIGKKKSPPPRAGPEPMDASGRTSQRAEASLGQVVVGACVNERACACCERNVMRFQSNKQTNSKPSMHLKLFLQNQIN